jgi:opacity protein-like surface antigen
MRLPCAAAVTLALLSPLAADAQERGAQLAGGYSYGRTEGTSLHGWTASLAFPLGGGSLSLVAEATGQYGELDGGTSSRRLSFLGGPRFTFGSGSARPFVHVLAGAVRTSGVVTVGPVSISLSSTDFGGAAGGGVDFRLADRWSLRVQADYLAVRAEGETQGDPRASVAAVWKLGR